MKKECENCKYSGRNKDYPSSKCENNEIREMLSTSYMGVPSFKPPRNFSCCKWEKK